MYIYVPGRPNGRCHPWWRSPWHAGTAENTRLRHPAASARRSPPIRAPSTAGITYGTHSRDPYVVICTCTEEPAQPNSITTEASSSPPPPPAPRPSASPPSAAVEAAESEGALQRSSVGMRPDAVDTHPSCGPPHLDDFRINNKTGIHFRNSQHTLLVRPPHRQPRP